MSADRQAPAERPLLEMRDVARFFDVSPPWYQRLFGGGSRRVLRAVDGVDLDLPRGRTLSLVGESGCGKSTLARLAVGLYPLSRGSIRFDGMEMSVRDGSFAERRTRRRIQMIFQDPFASLNPRWRVARIIGEPIRVHEPGTGEAERRSRVRELLEMVGLDADAAARYPHQFSGGQRQRISIARALAARPDLLICDEPTSALDVSVQAQILNLMRELQEELGLTYLFISHDLSAVRFISDYVGVMYLGRLVEWGEAETLFRNPRHPYTRKLLESVPNLAEPGRARTPIAGEVPSPLSPPPGCHFNPRCPLAMAKCRTDTPGMVRTGPGGVRCFAVEEETATA
ncbi:dipeptide ABC transporter ATP-binding protein [Paralimibaculum aggregatum]|uniref:Dipeptide ABC transporter ATP-binding protein n=1 Tax=Paralimibaculum aggregatum TaxID=3036245 RepID=A0ABQ6LJT8_9RHOB|nr:oligopeptide/dipeptide ABC transporter ATP-binding protein [Limibaculum sp. NKW23]GMG82464.1 dipeptide ABC transporter ATP-binding protein [Limibaculum sp. NKW23]